jgi:osmoprotectant transport system substrate-binding protein
VAYVACLALAIVCCACACACGSAAADHADGAAQHGAVTVGSFDFPEGVLLAGIYAGALTAQGFPVRVLPDLGPRELVDPALMSGLVQVVPDYSATGRGLVVGRPSAAQDANVIVVTAATAARYGLRSVADLARVAPRLAFGGPPERPEEVYCLLGLKQVYGLRFRIFIPLDAGGPLTLQALQAGDIGVALLFSTDPAITADHLVVLADDRGLQPAENVVPLVRRDVVGRYGPRLLAVLDTVSARLTTGSLRALNARVEPRGEDPRLEAGNWLRTQGLPSMGKASR